MLVNNKYKKGSLQYMLVTRCHLMKSLVMAMNAKMVVKSSLSAWCMQVSSFSRCY